MGPGTNIAKRLARGDPGINRADNTARAHDLAYRDIGLDKSLSPQQRKQKEIEADLKVLKAWWPDRNLPEVKLAGIAIASKLIAQGVGVLKWGKFID